MSLLYGGWSRGKNLTAQRRQISFLDLYYNRSGGGVAATATDITTNKTQVVNIGEGKNAVFNDAEVAGVLKNPASSPTADSRLWQFTDTAVTTYSGVHGTMTGPWTTSEVVDTTNGGASGQMVMSPSFLFNNNANFRRLDSRLPAEVTNQVGPARPSSA